MGGSCVFALAFEAERHEHGDLHHCCLLGLAEDLHHEGVPRNRCVGYKEWVPLTLAVLMRVGYFVGKLRLWGLTLALTGH